MFKIHRKKGSIVKQTKEQTITRIIIGVAIVILLIFVYFMFTNTKYTNAYVPNQQLNAGTVLRQNMISKIQVPLNTPKGFLTDEESLVGQKLKVNVQEKQLIYPNDLMSNTANGYRKIPKNFIVTTIFLPSQQAVGGTVSIGNHVDILGVNNLANEATSSDVMKNYLGSIADNSYGGNGSRVYSILANVEILDTTNGTSHDQSKVTDKEKNQDMQGAFYTVALSYDNYKKLLLAEQYLQLYLNLSPSQNGTKKPLFDQLNNTIIGPLDNASVDGTPKQSVTPKDNNSLSQNDSSIPSPSSSSSTSSSENGKTKHKKDSNKKGGDTNNSSNENSSISPSSTSQ